MRLRSCTLLGVLLLCVPAAFADVIVGSAGAGWQTFPASQGQAYWDNPTASGQGNSFADFLAGTGQFADLSLDSFCCSSSPAPAIGPGNLPYWGMSGGQADPNFYFNSMLGSAFFGVLYSSPTLGPAGSFGWYDVNNPSVLNPLFTGGLPPGFGGVLAGSQNYGLWVEFPDDCFVFTQSSLNTCGLAGQQMFTAGTTSPGGTYGAFFIGVNDPASGTNGFDDVVIQTSPINTAITFQTPVPEPASLLLLVTGLCAIGCGLRSFRAGA